MEEITAYKTNIKGETYYLLKEEDFKRAIKGLDYKEVLTEFKKEWEKL
jgi:YHS domain-containing protein